MHTLKSKPQNNSYILYQNIVTYRPIARQRLGKYIPAEACARNNRTYIARQRISKQAFSTIERLCFLHGPCKVVIRKSSEAGSSSTEGNVENWVEFWRWQSNVIEKK
jgi:hypothetical protein